MSFQTEILKNSSEKFSIMRLSYRKLFYSVAGPTPVITQMVDEVLSCENSNGVMTRVYVDPANNDEYFFDDITKELKTYQDAGAIIASCYIYLSVGKNRAIGKDPTSPNSNLVEWAGRLKDEPEFEQNVENILTGTLTTNSSSITLINTDGKYDYLLDKKTYLINSIFDVWIFCNGLSNIKKLCSGVAIDCSSSNGELTISVTDSNKKLDAPCYMGYNYSEVYFESSAYPNRDPNKNGSVVPYLFGPVSNSDFKSLDVGYEIQNLEEAKCSSYSTVISGSNNRSWVCYRCASASTLNEQVSFSVTGVSYSITLNDILDTARFHEGDYFKLGTSILKVSGRGTNAVYAYLISGPAQASPKTIETFEVPFVTISVNGTVTEALPSIHYTCTSSNSSSGNKIIGITFLNNTIDALIGAPLNPNEHIVSYRGYSDPVTCGNAVKKIVESVGMNLDIVNDYSNILDEYTYACLSIPKLGDSLGSSRSYIEKILESSSSYIYQDDDQRFKFDCFTTPSSGQVITDNDILLGSESIQGNTQDVYTNLRVFKENYRSLVGSFEGNTEIYSYANVILFDELRTKELNSVLYPLAVSTYMDIITTRKYNKLRFTTKNLGYSLKIGDAISRNGKIFNVVGLKKSAQSVEVECIDSLVVT